MESKEHFAREELTSFLQEHAAEDSANSIDEIVLSYMVSILEELGSNEIFEEVFDVEQFTEMMGAYLPGFSEIDSLTISEWMFIVSAKLEENTRKEVKPQCSEKTKKPKKCKKEQTAKDPRTPTVFDTRTERQRSRSRCTDSTSSQEACSAEEEPVGNSEMDQSIEMLCEMFPTACSTSVTHCLCVADGNVEGAVQLLLEHQENKDNLNTIPSKPHKTSAKKSSMSQRENKEFKKSIVQRYSYVDMDEDKKSHRPIAPKTGPKKLVRYLDGQVVSTKGERFTEIKKREDEDMKKTYVSLKPAKQYRFH